MNSLKSDATRKVFGQQKLTGADAGVVSSLTMLGPWGVALIAAYLAGQGLVKLAEKIQEMRGSTMPAIPLTTEEERQIQEAIQVMESERFAQTFSETTEWIKAHPPEEIGISRLADSLTGTVAEINTALDELINSPSNDPRRSGLCRTLLNLLPKLEIMTERFGSPGSYDALIKQVEKWLDKKCDITQV